METSSDFKRNELKPVSSRALILSSHVGIFNGSTALILYGSAHERFLEVSILSSFLNVDHFVALLSQIYYLLSQ